MDAPDRTADLAADPPTRSRAADPATADPPPADVTGDHAPAATSPDPRPSVPGYSIDGELGTGGMGVVYRAVHRGLNRPAALKMVRGHDRADPRHLVRFLAEAEAVAAVQHPHVVRVYDFGHADGRPYLAMELLPGGSLADRLKAGRLDPREAATLIAKLAGAVQAAHDLGIVHRDLKPANVLFDAAGEPKVTDFGLAKRGAGSDLTATQAVMGTPAYLTPEQVAGGSKSVGPAADVYALGTVLYECLTGTRPFDGPDLPVLMRQIADDPPEPPRRRVPTLPRDIELVCLRCLEKRPADRYPSAAALADDLRRFAAGEPVSVRPAGLLERGYKWARRKPTVAALYAATAAGALLVAVAAAVGLLWREAVAERANAESARDLLAGEKRLTEDALAKLGEEQGRAAAALKDAESARDQLRKEQDKLALSEYARTMEVAHQEALGNNAAGATALLEGTRPDLRGWEWHYVHRLCNGQRHTLAGQSFERDTSCWSPDGSRLLTSLWNGTMARVWDAKTWEVSATLVGSGKDEYASNAVWSPDGSRVAQASGRTVRVWDARTGAELATHTFPISVWYVYWSPDRSRLAATSVSDAGVRVWDARAGGEVVALRLPPGAPLDAAWDPTGARIATAGEDGHVRVWDARTGAEVVAIRASRGAVFRVAWNPDGTRLAAGSSAVGRTARVWDARTGAEVFTLGGHEDYVFLVAWSPDGSRLLTADFGGIGRIWDARTGSELAVLKGHTQQPNSARWSPDGSKVATASADGTARVWDGRTGAELTVLRGHTGGLWAADWSPDGTRLATAAGDGTTRIWELAPASGATPLRGLKGSISDARWSPDRTRVVTISQAGDVARVWDARTGAELTALSGHTALVACAAWSPDGRKLATASEDGTARVWDARYGGEVMTLRGHLDGLCEVAWNSSGSRIATSSMDGTVRVWDSCTGAQLWRFWVAPKGFLDRVYATVDWVPNKPQLTTSAAGYPARILDAESGTEVKSLPTGFSLAWGPTGRHLALRVGDELRILDEATGTEAKSRGLHAGAVMAAWSPDGRRLATGSADGTIRLWDPASGTAVLTLGERRGGNGIVGLAWSADGTKLLSATRDGTLRSWDTTPTDPRFRGKSVAPQPREAKR